MSDVSPANIEYGTRTVGELAELVTKGTTPTSIGAKYSKSGIHFVRATDLKSRVLDYEGCTLFISEATDEKLSRSRVLGGDVLLAIAGTIGRTTVVPTDAPPLNCNQAVCIIRCGKDLDAAYFCRWLESESAKRQMGRSTVTGVISNLSLGQVKSLELPLPPLFEQRRIAAILDKADALRQKRREAIAKLDQLLQSVFLEMFGDPVTNPKGWPKAELPHLSQHFCDGPFGSNLKTSHYRDRGVRVVRLQNIGVWKFVGRHAAYISQLHYESLPRNHCKGGDVLIGTLGEPNLRACILPNTIDKALNKADCVLFRPLDGKATSEYICGLLNSPSIVRKASGLSLGQTRSRISMGRLKGLVVPTPPYARQRDFTVFVSKLKVERKSLEDACSRADELFYSVQQRAFTFSGKL